MKTDSLKKIIYQPNVRDSNIAKSILYQQHLKTLLRKKNVSYSNVVISDINNTQTIYLGVLYNKRKLRFIRHKMDPKSRYKPKILFKYFGKRKVFFKPKGHFKEEEPIKKKILYKRISKIGKKVNFLSLKRYKVYKNRIFKSVKRNLFFRKKLLVLKKKIRKLFLLKLKSRIKKNVSRKNTSKKKVIRPSINFYLKLKLRKQRILKRNSFLSGFFLPNVKNTKIRIYPLNMYTVTPLRRKIYARLRSFIKKLFSRNRDLFDDFVCMLSLLARKKASLEGFLRLFSRVLRNTHKYKHGIFLRFAQEVAKRLILSAYTNVLGVKIRIAGRIRGGTRANSFVIKNGSIKLSTVDADTSYAYQHVYTVYGVFGIKMWVTYKPRKDRIKVREVRKLLVKLRGGKKISKADFQKIRQKALKRKAFKDLILNNRFKLSFNHASTREQDFKKHKLDYKNNQKHHYSKNKHSDNSNLKKKNSRNQDYNLEYNNKDRNFNSKSNKNQNKTNLDPDRVFDLKHKQYSKDDSNFNKNYINKSESRSDNSTSREGFKNHKFNNKSLKSSNVSTKNNLKNSSLSDDIFNKNKID